MISHRSDLLLFERSINYHPRAEVWLLKVEYSAQETVGKLIGNAVSSFPKQPLDEWIIDYPQQTILSTIHLILTHEINEMLHEMRAARKSEDPSMSHSGPTDTMGLINESSNINTRSIQQLQDSSRITQTDDYHNKQEEASVEPEEIQEVDENSKVEAEGEGEPQDDNGEQGNNILVIVATREEATETVEQKKTPKEELKKEEEKNELGGKLGVIRRQEEEAKVKLMQMKLRDEKYGYVKDMFGLDFEVEKLTEGQIDIEKLGIGEFKEEAMKALQEKSFKGLYLRLQFWINQIFKRLHGKTEG